MNKLKELLASSTLSSSRLDHLLNTYVPADNLTYHVLYIFKTKVSSVPCSGRKVFLIYKTK
jgi:hypothetical protein